MPQNSKINTGYLNNLVNGYKNRLANSTQVSDIITFTESKWGLNFELFPMQRFILKVFYGLPLDEMNKSIPLRDELNEKELGMLTEADMMDFLIRTKRTNITEYKAGNTFRELCLCCGRRASKSSIISIVCTYEAYRMVMLGNPQAYFGFPSGWEIGITTVASVDDQAETLFKMIKNNFLECSFLNSRIQGDTQTHFSVRTDADMKLERDATLQIYCGGAGSSALRSKNNLVVVMDEAAHYANFGKSSAEKAWKDLTPSVASFVPKGSTKGEGKIITLSSPLGKSGFFWEKVCESYDNPEDILMFKMYSSMINIRMDSAALKSEYRKNRETFLCEYCGEFSDTVTGWCTSEELEKCVNSSRMDNADKGEVGQKYYMGLDYGGKNDGTSVCIVHKEGETIVLDYADVYYAKMSDVWESSAGYYSDVNRLFSDEEIIPMNKFADEIKKLCEKFNVVGGWFDQFNGYGLLELLKERGLTQFEMKGVTQSLNMQVYDMTKSLLGTGFLRLFSHPVLIPELASLEKTVKGNTVMVEAPQKTGYHDDISDAFARAVYAAYTSKQKNTRTVTLGMTCGKGSMDSASYNTFKMRRFMQHSGVDVSAVREYRKIHL